MIRKSIEGVTVTTSVDIFASSDISIQILIMGSVKNSIMIESSDVWCLSTTGRENNYVTAGHITKNVRTKKMFYALRWGATLVSPPRLYPRFSENGILHQKNLMVHGSYLDLFIYCHQTLLSFRALDTLLLNCNVTQIHQCIVSSC